MDVFRSESASQVFFEIVLGNTTPKAIADSLTITPPSVAAQLRRLRDVGIVELGRKEGKFQHYKINWQSLIKKATDRAYYLTTTLVMANLRDDREQREKIKRLKRQLSENELFLRFFEAYFHSVAEISLKKDVYLVMTIFDTISNAIRVFEQSLISLFPYLDKSHELYALLETWYGLASKAISFNEKPLQQTLASLNLLKSE